MQSAAETRGHNRAMSIRSARNAFASTGIHATIATCVFYSSSGIQMDRIQMDGTCASSHLCELTCSSFCVGISERSLFRQSHDQLSATSAGDALQCVERRILTAGAQQAA